jgi:hypothetical protein
MASERQSHAFQLSRESAAGVGIARKGATSVQYLTGRDYAKSGYSINDRIVRSKRPKGSYDR